MDARTRRWVVIVALVVLIGMVAFGSVLGGR
jgi:hypothetical protein